MERGPWEAVSVGDRSSRSGAALLAAGIVAGGVLAPARASADDGLWPSDWPRVGVVEVAAYGAVGVVGAAGNLFVASPASPNATGGVLFDDGFRNILRDRSVSGRDTAETVSTVGVGALLTLPFLDDAFTVGLSRRDGDAALELALIDSEAYALTVGVTWAIKQAVARERPSPYGTQTNASFPSEHTAFAFTAASLLCTEHLEMHLWGSGNDEAVCADALVFASGIGALRIVADHHYATDVVAGAAIGGLSGWLLPKLLHFHHAPDTEERSRALLQVSSVAMTSNASGAGLALAGIWR
jgi:membrane-associated phospholipid phosphatase